MKNFIEDPMTQELGREVEASSDVFTRDSLKEGTKLPGDEGIRINSRNFDRVLIVEVWWVQPQEGQALKESGSLKEGTKLPGDEGIRINSRFDYESGDDHEGQVASKESGSLKEGTIVWSQPEKRITNCANLTKVEGLGESGGFSNVIIDECPLLDGVDFKFLQPGYSTLDSAGEEDSADKESYWLEQLNICIDAYPEKETSLMLPV